MEIRRLIKLTVAQLVERNSEKVRVEGSIPSSGSNIFKMKLYQNVIPEKNIGKKSGKEFALSYKEGEGMFFLYKGGEGIAVQCNETDDRKILDALVEEGELKLVSLTEYLN